MLAPQARTDPNFKVGESALGMQVFCNAVTHVPTPSSGDMADLQHAAKELPTHACSVNDKDGYRPEATLFVDEDWMALRNAREGKLGTLAFRPTVRFCSSHYKYIKDADGLRIVQVGIGASERRSGLNFVPPPQAEVAQAGAGTVPANPPCLH